MTKTLCCVIIETMIITANKTPEWVYAFAGMLKENLPEGVLKAKVLAPIRTASFTFDRGYDIMYSDGRLADPNIPIPVPRQEERELRVEYRDLIPIYRYKDLWDRVRMDWGIDSWHEVYPEERMNYGEQDTRHHTFRVGECLLYTWEVGKVRTHVIVFQNLYDADWYICMTQTYNINNGPLVEWN